MSYLGHQGYVKPNGQNKDSWHQYTCGHCNSSVSGAVLAHDGSMRKWLVCPQCGNGSYLGPTGIIYPGSVVGPEVKGVPQVVYDAYLEARNCMSVNSFNASELLCRKLLMHIAVEKGADEGKNFSYYLDYLETLGYITPPMKKWVDIIRKNGNDATHKIEPSNKERAMSSLMFTAELLRIIYEMDHFANYYGNVKDSQ